MKEFNLERALAGDPVVTRDERNVSQFTLFECNNKKIIYAVVDGKDVPFTFSEEKGLYNPGSQSKFDLFMGTVKKEGWINIYEDNFVSDLYESKDEAIKNELTSIVKTCTIKIEWEE